MHFLITIYECWMMNFSLTEFRYLRLFCTTVSPTHSSLCSSALNAKSSLEFWLHLLWFFFLSLNAKEKTTEKVHTFQMAVIIRFLKKLSACECCYMVLLKIIKNSQRKRSICIKNCFLIDANDPSAINQSIEDFGCDSV